MDSASFALLLFCSFDDEVVISSSLCSIPAIYDGKNDDKAEDAEMNRDEARLLMD